MVSDFASSLLTFSKEPEPTLKTFCNFIACLLAVFGNGHKLEGLPHWLREAKLACQRFEIEVLTYGKSQWAKTIKEKSVAALLEEISADPCELTAGLDKAFRVIQQSKVIFEITQNPSTQPEDILSNIKSLLTLESLETEEVRYFFPEQTAVIASFRAKVNDLASLRMDKVELTVKKGKNLVDKYRRAGCRLSSYCIIVGRPFHQLGDLSNSETVSVSVIVSTVCILRHSTVHSTLLHIQVNHRCQYSLEDEGCHVDV